MPGIQPTRIVCRRRVHLLALVTLVAGGLLAGCGGVSPRTSAAASGPLGTSASSTTASARGGSSESFPSAEASNGASSGGSPPSPAQVHRDGLAFSNCMRANGVPTFPDPTSGGGLRFPTGAGFNPSSPAVNAARAKCQKLLPGGGPAPPGSQTHPSAQTLARFRRIARCMRRHGVSEFPDPRTSVPSNPFGSGISEISNIEEVIFLFPATINQSSPVFTQAAAACHFPLHNH